MDRSLLRSPRLLSLLGPWLLALSAAAQTSPATPTDDAIAEVAAPIDPAPFRIGDTVDDLAFTDLDGRSGRLSDFADRNALVIVVRDVSCPVSRNYGLRTAEIERAYAERGVSFLYLDLSTQDSIEDCRAEASEYGFRGRYVRDPEGRFGWQLRARTTTDVFVLDQMRKLRYRGAIDDQMGRGVTKVEPTREYLKAALDSILERKRVADPATSAPGCRLRDFDAKPAAESSAPAITWHGEIRRLVQRRCQDCHRQGGAGPFSLEEFAQADGHSAMIQKVVTERVMPPWFATPQSGPFTNDLRLTDEERLTLLRWIQDGCPEGDAAGSPPPRTWSNDWVIGKPDVVVESSVDVPIPATGVLDYVRVECDYVAPEDMWVQSMQVMPRCPQVVHHLAFHAVDPDSNGMSLFEGYLPGKTPTVYPPGLAKLVKKGTKFGFSIHYTPNGKACVDRTRAGFVLAKEPPKFRVSGVYVREQRFTIPPGVKDYPIVAERRLDQECDVYRIIPHMHLRGRSSKTELVLPDGRTLVPLEIPLWDPNWQFAYELKEPIHVPAGTLVRVTNHFDNSAENLRNPDPTKLVRQGPQIWDEMSEAYVEYLRPVRKRPQENAAAETEKVEKSEKADGGK